MKRKLVFVFTFFILISLGLRSQSQQIIPRYIDDVLSARGEVYFKFTVNNMLQVDSLTRQISIDNVVGSEIFAYANRNEFENFLSYNLPYTILPPPASLYPAVMRDDVNVKSINAWDFYPTYTAYESMMYQFQADYPALCKVYVLGTLPSGRKIIALKISDNVNSYENEPRFNYSSSMHGDELTGYVLMLRLIDYLLSNYGTDQKITNLVNNIEIWITPLENPDGTYAGGNSTVAGATRSNANSVDLNRNYRNPKVGDHPDGNAWQQETLITMAFVDSMKFTMSANVHGGIECINYPWDSWVSSQKIHADDDWWQFVSHQYADTARLYSPSNYMNPSGSSFFNGVTNGGDWYVALGSRQDYLTAFTNSREFTIEISNTKTPAASTLPNYWNYNYRSFLNYMQQSLYGLRGIVTDSCSGQPVEAQVFISGHDVDNSHVYSMLPVGNYHRPLFSGTYAVTFSAPGYASKSFSNVLISNNNTTILNVALAPQSPQAIVTASPATSCTGEIDFEAQIQNGDTWAWHFGDGTSASTSTTTHVYSQSGVYYPYLAITNCTGTQNIFVPDSIIIDLPAAPVAQNMSRCGPGSLTLTASAQGTINWFNSMSTQVPLDTGNTFTTPVLSQSATYYVESHQSQNAFTGALNPAGGQNYNSNFSHYLVFDCFKPVTLLSVDVYASIAGNRTIYLRNSSSQVIDSVVVNIPANGSRVTLNLDIPIGTNLQLAGPVYPNLYRTQSSSLSYPYTIPGYISIKNSSATTNPTGYYYFFYDWEVKLEECVSARIPVNATIDVMPVAAFSQLVNNLDVSFTSTSLGAATYLWDFGDGQTSTLQNPVHTYGSYGIFDVQLIVTNTCGSDVFNFQLNLNTLPPVANFEADDTTVSEGIYVNFSDLTLNNPNSWQWVFEGGTPAASTIQNPVVQYNVAGTYFVKLTVINAFGTDSLTKSGYITVFPGTLAPAADFTANQTVIDAGDSVQFTDISLYTPTSWLWNVEGGTPSSSTVQNPSITYNTPGTYFVSLIATNAFGTDYEVKYDFIQVNPSGIEDMSSVRMLSVYPNPCASYLYVLLPAGIYGYTLQICDVSGKTQMLNPQAEQQGNILQLNVASLAQGMYFIDITNGFQTYRARFVK